MSDGGGGGRRRGGREWEACGVGDVCDGDDV